jgi:hypothetical protein
LGCGGRFIPIQHINHNTIAKPIVPKTRPWRGLQRNAAVNSGERFNISRQAKRRRKIKPGRRIKAQNEPIAAFFCAVSNRFGPIHHHPAIGGMSANPKADRRCLLRVSRDAQSHPEQQQNTRRTHQSKLASSRSISL